jgi:superoxide dismutase
MKLLFGFQKLETSPNLQNAEVCDKVAQVFTEVNKRKGVLFQQTLNLDKSVLFGKGWPRVVHQKEECFQVLKVQNTETSLCLVIFFFSF